MEWLFEDRVVAGRRLANVPSAPTTSMSARHPTTRSSPCCWRNDHEHVDETDAGRDGRLAPGTCAGRLDATPGAAAGAARPAWWLDAGAEPALFDAGVSA